MIGNHIRIPEITKELILFLYDNHAIRIGDFILSSGKKSKFYIDLRLLQSYPLFFRKAILLLKNNIITNFGIENFDYICSIPTSGTIFGSSLCYEMFKPHIYVRKDLKGYGTQKNLEGYLKPHSRIIFVDDVATTGNSLIAGINLLKSKAFVKGVFVLIDRGQGSKELFDSTEISFHSVISIFDIITVLYINKRINDQVFSNIQEEIN